MKGIEFNVMFDLLIAAYGAFLIYSARKMKITGEPSSAILPRYELMRCMDKKGFIDAVYNKTMLFGIIILVYGIAEIVNEKFISNSYIDLIGMIVFVVSFIWFVASLRQIRSRFIK